MVRSDDEAIDRRRDLSRMTTATIYTSTCKICDRDVFGPVVVLNSTQWRHEHCAIGSAEWKDYFLRLPKEEQQPLREYYESCYGGSQS